ncbi:hypothetical protein BLNAU_9414 [Blattamonas nauphoetae]|uniref:RRM domain-containing protein n=1 Tax=Blattamonas nauphoetae TaxID=2049346 RepID=A0ABQ9XVQ6_9EUKA|nr:hypothetical protein BLNAU_9414 [Blattamonas nauphoetae]
MNPNRPSQDFNPLNSRFDVILRNVPTDFTESDVYNIMERYGKVVSVSFIERRSVRKVIKTKIAVVTFTESEATLRAVHDENPPTVTSKQADPGETFTLSCTFSDEHNCLHISNIPPRLTKAEVKEMLDSFTQVPSEEVIITKVSSHRSSNLGWAYYSSHTLAVAALQAISHTTRAEFPINASFAKARPTDPAIMEHIKTVFLRGLPKIATLANVKTFVRELIGDQAYSHISGIVVPLDQKSRKRLGHAFIHFNDKAVATRCLDLLKTAKYGDMELFAEWAMPRDDNVHDDKDGKKGKWKKDGDVPKGSRKTKNLPQAVESESPLKRNDENRDVYTPKAYENPSNQTYQSSNHQTYKPPQTSKSVHNPTSFQQNRGSFFQISMPSHQNQTQNTPPQSREYIPQFQNEPAKIQFPVTNTNQQQFHLRVSFPQHEQDRSMEQYTDHAPVHVGNTHTPQSLTAFRSSPILHPSNGILTNPPAITFNPSTNRQTGIHQSIGLSQLSYGSSVPTTTLPSNLPNQFSSSLPSNLPMSLSPASRSVTSMNATPTIISSHQVGSISSPQYASTSPLYGPKNTPISSPPFIPSAGPSLSHLVPASLYPPPHNPSPRTNPSGPPLPLAKKSPSALLPSYQTTQSPSSSLLPPVSPINTQKGFYSGPSSAFQINTNFDIGRSLFDPDEGNDVLLDSDFSPLSSNIPNIPTTTIPSSLYDSPYNLPFPTHVPYDQSVLFLQPAKVSQSRLLDEFDGPSSLASSLGLGGSSQGSHPTSLFDIQPPLSSNSSFSAITSPFSGSAHSLQPFPSQFLSARFSSSSPGSLSQSLPSGSDDDSPHSLTIFGHGGLLRKDDNMPL